MAKDPASVAKKWADGLGRAATDGTIEAGIRAVQVAPGQAAARQKDVWAVNVAQAKDRWAANVAAVSNAEWQDAAINKGLSRVADGASKAENKMASFMGKLLPQVDTIKRNLRPRGSFADNKARMNAMVDGLHALKGQLKG